MAAAVGRHVYPARLLRTPHDCNSFGGGDDFVAALAEQAGETAESKLIKPP